MMSEGFVELYVNSATEILGTVSQAGFSNVALGINSIAISAAIIAFVLAIFNHFLQIGYMPPGKMLGLLIKLILISYLGLRWNNFTIIADGVQNAMDDIANSLLDLITSNTKGNGSLPGAIDSIMSRIATTSDQALSRAAWYTGSILTGIILICLTLLGACAALIIIYSKMMISIYLMIAPAFICCLIFDRSSDYFYRWLQGAIAYMLYPIITASVISLIAAITNSFFSSFNDSNVSTIAVFMPCLTLTVIGIMVILFIPAIVAGLSGMIQHVSPSNIAEPIIQLAMPTKKNDNNKTYYENSSYTSSSSPRRDTSEIKPSGPFPGEPARMLKFEQEIHGKD